MARYVALLCGEIGGARRACAARGLLLPEMIDTVYLGGGTPSLLSAEQMRAVFGAIRGEFAVSVDAEMTMEAAPGQIGEAALEAAQRLGVNRVSLGVQSFSDREAQAVGRTHTGESCLAEIRRLQEQGIASVGVDLIAGLPYQTAESWERSLETAVGCGLAHLSVYMLEVDEESRLGREILGGGARMHAPAVPDDDLVAEMYEAGCDRLARAGYPQYEISNFAAGGFRSRHNQKYWTRQPYLGLGLDAHSMLQTPEGGAARWANPDDLLAYDGAGPGQAQRLSQREVFEEIVFLTLRLNDGLAPEALAEFPAAWVREVSDGVKLLESEGLVENSRDRWRLTSRGRLLSSEVFGELLAGVAA